jgi:hypothetical protein
MYTDHPPARWREVAAIGLLVALCDLAIYRGGGYAGYAALFAAAPLLLIAGAPRIGRRRAAAAVGVMLALLAARLVWCGSILSAAVGFALIVAFAMALAGIRPFVLEAIVYAAQAFFAGFLGLRQYVQLASRRSPPVGRIPWISFLLPAAALLVFGAIFILANPDLTTAFGERFQRFVTRLHDVLIRFAPTPGEMIFWGFVAWITAGLLRPLIDESMFLQSSRDLDAEETPFKPGPAPLYAAFRNTLATVVVLFAAYLVFEFRTLWLREFPKGFYYAGYAHQGAAWLTFALALATAMLSLVFRGAVVTDPRLPKLRTLAWLWSAENLLLAAAVYNRLFIYIGFNGMTRMRMIGLFGISTVVVGFLIVLWKIARDRDFLWLVRRHLWTLAGAFYLFALTPVDWIVQDYNVRRILTGDPAPSVQISVHPINSEGVLQLPPLLECDDPTIRDGVHALLEQRRLALEERRRQRTDRGWTAWQIADDLALERLRSLPPLGEQTADAAAREEVLRRFHEYAYQWY